MYSVIFDSMFVIAPIIVFVGFIFVFGTIIHRGMSVAKDKRKPIIPVHAKVLTKCTQVNGDHAYTYYYATFELENGERIEFAIPSHQIGYIIEGDTGTLSFQGNLFVKFERV